MSWVLGRHPGEHDVALFAGGELGPLGRWRIEGHLEGCARCRQAVAEFFELRSRVIDLGELPAIDWIDLADRIHRRAETARERPRPVVRWRPAWAGAAALVLLVAAGWYVNRTLQATPVVVSLDGSAGAVELRVGNGQILTLLHDAQKETPVSWRVSAGAVSARYLDAGTGQITVNHVYAP